MGSHGRLGPAPELVAMAQEELQQVYQPVEMNEKIFMGKGHGDQRQKPGDAAWSRKPPGGDQGRPTTRPKSSGGSCTDHRLPKEISEHYGDHNADAYNTDTCTADSNKVDKGDKERVTDTKFLLLRKQLYQL